MKQSSELLQDFKQLSSREQYELLQKLRAEFESKGKLLEVVESDRQTRQENKSSESE